MNLNPHFLSRLYVIVLLSLVVSLSVLQGRYTLDPHHWGLMLSNAQDLWLGKLPYQEIFIQYGILTTLIQAAAYGLSPRLLSGITVTAFCYALGLLFAYRIARHVLLHEKSALYLITSLVLFHPIAIYPWANYIAFPFLMYGLYVLILRNPSSTRLFLGGLSFGLAILAREGLAPAISLLIFLSIIFDLLNKRSNRSIAGYVGLLAGLLTPPGIFFTYLYFNDLISYWVLLSFELPKIYAQESFKHIGNGFILKAILDAVVHGWRHGEIRWIFISIIWLLNLGVFINSLIKIRDQASNPALAKLSLVTLLLISSSLHLAEIFRIATASGVGLITLYYILEKQKNLEKYFFIITSIWMLLTLGQNRWTGTNYFLPSKKVIMSAQLVQSPEIFYGNRWSPEAINYYQFVQRTLRKLSENPCQLHYQYNATRDSFFAPLSPFVQLQIAPYGNGESVNQLRPDLDFVGEIQKAKSIVILQMIPKEELWNYQAPQGFGLYAHHLVPQMWQMPENQELLILVPNGCMNPGAVR